MWIPLLMLLILAGLGVAAAGLVLQLRARPIPGVFWLMVPALMALVGLLGTLSGIGEASAAVALASADLRAPLMAKGIAISLNVLLLAGIGVGALGLVGALGIGLGSALGAGAEARLRPLHLSVASGGVLVVVAGAGWGAVGAADELGVAAFASPVLALFAGVGLALASLRASSAAAASGRSAASIAASGACAAVALLGFALFTWASSSRLAFEALALASVEQRDLLWAAGQQAATQGGLLAAAAAGGLGLLALGVAALDGGRAFAGRNPLLAGLMVLPMLVIVGSAAFGAVRVGGLMGEILGL